jgi:hypothetical protein
MAEWDFPNLPPKIHDAMVSEENRMAAQSRLERMQHREAARVAAEKSAAENKANAQIYGAMSQLPSYLEPSFVDRHPVIAVGSVLAVALIGAIQIYRGLNS